MRKRYFSKKKKILIITSVLICFSILSCSIYYWMYPVIMRYAVSVAETIMLNAANEAIVEVLEENNVTYGDIVNLSNNSEGYVTSLEIEIYSVNSLKSKISSETARNIENKEFYDVGIPIGTFLGNTYTSGFGPMIKFKMQLTSTAFVDFSHEFKAAGINQVLHIIMVNIDIKGSLIVAGYNKGINTKTSAIAAQTVIVGKSPEAFTNVIESEKDNTGGLINDYGAVVE